MKRNHEVAPAPKPDTFTMPVSKKEKTKNYALLEHAAEEEASKEDNMPFRFMDLEGGKSG